MTYEIRDNNQFNSKEIYFAEKPNEAIRNALKTLKFRWNGVKKCWYGFAQEHEIVNAILNTSTEEEPATVVTDGYLGGGAIYGSKSNLNLYGSDLAKAIRQDIKKAGIKGVTIASKHGNIQATINTNSEDLKTKEQFIDEYEINPSMNWIYIFDENEKTKAISTDLYFTMDAQRQEELRKQAAAFEFYKDYEQRQSINHYCIDKYNGFSSSGISKIKQVLDIINAYRYDNSNSMVDYFDTNFYIDIYTQPKAKKEIEAA